jgi:hypothetical protein
MELAPETVSSAEKTCEMDLSILEQATFIYGSAWKGSMTKDLVVEAVSAGFTAVDTAAQPKHNREDLVGEALREVLRRSIVRREDISVRVVLNEECESIAHALDSCRPSFPLKADKTPTTCLSTQISPSASRCTNQSPHPFEIFGPERSLNLRKSPTLTACSYTPQ